MASRQHLSIFLKGRAIGRMEAGQTQAEVSRIMNIPTSVVSRLWRQFQTTGDVSRRPVQGRPRVTTEHDDRYLGLTARRHRTMSARQLSLDLSAATGRTVSRSTVSRRLHLRGLYARRPVVCVPLTVVHKRDRLEWSRQHLDWTQDQWSKVLFSDESRFSLQPDSRRVLIWREPGTRYHPSNIFERDHYGGGGLLVWGGIMLNGRTDLHVFESGSVTGRRYADEILEPCVRLFRGAVGPEFIFMDDNARPHRAHLVDDFLESEDIRRMEWPARSPDLNPIEHVWDALGRRVGERQPPPRNLQELKMALLEEWVLLPDNLILNLVQSMNRRCMACRSVRGNHTPY